MSTLSNNRRSDQNSADGVENVIYAFDFNGNITFLNGQGERLLGYSSEEARQLNITQVLAPEFADDVREQILSSTTRRIGCVYEIEMIARDGRRVPLEVSTSVVFRKGGPAEIQGIAVPFTRG